MILSIVDASVPRAVTRSLLATLISTVGFVGPCGADETAAPLQIAFHVDVIGHQFADQREPDQLTADQINEAATGDDAELPSPRTMEFNLIGLPVRLGTKDEGEDARTGLAAGLQADYEAALSDHLSFTASTKVSKTGYLDNSWGTDRAEARTALRYQHDGLLLALEPSWSLDMVETTATQSDYGATARFSKTLFQRVDLSGGIRYGRHDAWNPVDDYTNASAYATLTYRIANRMKLDLSYATTYKLPDELQAGSLSLDDLQYAENSAGPTITMTFPLWDALDIAATYRYCRSADDIPRRGGDRRVDDLQSFDMSAVWHADDSDYGGINFTAAYAYDRLATNANNADEQSHAATIAMAIPF